MKNPVIIIKVGRKVVEHTRDSRTVADAKRNFLHRYPGYNPKYITATIKHTR